MPTATRLPASDCRRSRLPLGTLFTGGTSTGATLRLCDRDGSLIPFARTSREREAAGDPRLSLEERYASRADYVSRSKPRPPPAPVAERLLLPADAAA